jgi:hypothetical protein
MARNPTSEGDIYTDQKTRLKYFRDNNFNVYCLNLDDMEIYFCCRTSMSRIENMTEEQKRPKEKL